MNTIFIWRWLFFFIRPAQFNLFQLLDLDKWSKNGILIDCFSQSSCYFFVFAIISMPRHFFLLCFHLASLLFIWCDNDRQHYFSNKHLSSLRWNILMWLDDKVSLNLKCIFSVIFFFAFNFQIDGGERLKNSISYICIMW